MRLFLDLVALENEIGENCQTYVLLKESLCFGGAKGSFLGHFSELKKHWFADCAPVTLGDAGEQSVVRVGGKGVARIRRPLLRKGAGRSKNKPSCFQAKTLFLFEQPHCRRFRFFHLTFGSKNRRGQL